MVLCLLYSLRNKTEMFIVFFDFDQNKNYFFYFVRNFLGMIFQSLGFTMVTGTFIKQRDF